MSALQENFQNPPSSIQEESNHHPRSPEDFINGVEEAFRTGAFALARDLSTEGAECYPDHSELQQYARVLAPPQSREEQLATQPFGAGKSQLAHKTPARIPRPLDSSAKR